MVFVTRLLLHIIVSLHRYKILQAAKKILMNSFLAECAGHILCSKQRIHWRMALSKKKAFRHIFVAVNFSIQKVSFQC